MTRKVAPALALTVCLATPCAGAQSSAPRDLHLAMGGSLWWDVGYVAVGGAMALGGLGLSPPDVNVAPLDGLGNRPWDPSIAAASDAVLVGGLLLTTGLGAVSERWGAGARGWDVVRAPLILGESAAMTLGVVSLLKNAVGECRPRAWDDAAGRCAAASREDRVAFPSGHTAPLAAMAGASLGMVLLPSGGRRAYWPLAATAAGLAATNLVLRVAAGAHSWVDTATGFALGASIGFGTAALHTVGPARSPAVTVTAQGVAVAGVF